MPSPPIALICNPAAAGGRAHRRLAQARAELQRLGRAHRTVLSRDPAHARSEARAASAAGETVVAVGGDGLLRLLAAELCGTGTPLGMVPAGRGNDLARVLGIPSEPAAAARIAAGGVTRAIDVAAVDSAPYLGIASFGFDSDANRIANEARLIRGNLVYLYAALRALAGWKPADFAVTVDGERHELRGYSVAVANSRAYGGGMFIAPQAELDDGLLDVVTVGEDSKASFLRHLPDVFKGRHLERPQVSTFRGAEVRVEASRPFAIYADGDPIGSVPATVTVERHALTVLVGG